MYMNNLIGLDLLVNNKKTYNKCEIKNDVYTDTNKISLEKDIKSEIMNIIHGKNIDIDISCSDNEFNDIDIIIDDMIKTQINTIKFKYSHKKVLVQNHS
jgi:hypothetical protein